MWSCPFVGGWVAAGSGKQTSPILKTPSPLTQTCNPRLLLPLLLQVDAVQLALQFGRAYFGCILAVNECCVVHHQGLQLLVRVTGTDSLTPEEQEERVGYHCYRGLVTPDTQVHWGQGWRSLQYRSQGVRVRGGGYQETEGSHGDSPVSCKVFLGIKVSRWVGTGLEHR